MIYGFATHRQLAISAETRREGDRQVHVIKYLTKDNKVRTAKYDGPRD